MFKKCTACHYQWQDREAFLTDPDIVIIGYQAGFDDVQEGLYLFNHQCRTTLALEVGKFEDLYDGPRYDKELAETEECSGFCLVTDELSVCSAKCKYAYLRDIIQIIRDWPKD